MESYVKIPITGKLTDSDPKLNVENSPEEQDDQESEKNTNKVGPTLIYCLSSYLILLLSFCAVFGFLLVLVLCLCCLQVIGEEKHAKMVGEPIAELSKSEVIGGGDHVDVVEEAGEEAGAEDVDSEKGQGGVEIAGEVNDYDYSKDNIVEAGSSDEDVD